MKNQIGITLIALVITIIVLLILAGITISTLAGDNGIFNKSISAANKTEIGKVVEAMKLEASNYYIAKKDSDEENVPEEFIDYLVDKGILTSNGYDSSDDSTLYVLNSEKLTDEKLKLGKGSIDTGDVYTVSVKQSSDKKEYSVEYYDKNNDCYVNELVYVKELANNTELITFYTTDAPGCGTPSGILSKYIAEKDMTWEQFINSKYNPLLKEWIQDNGWKDEFEIYLVDECGISWEEWDGYDSICGNKVFSLSSYGVRYAYAVNSRYGIFRRCFRTTTI